MSIFVAVYFDFPCTHKCADKIRLPYRIIAYRLSIVAYRRLAKTQADHAGTQQFLHGIQPLPNLKIWRSRRASGHYFRLPEVKRLRWSQEGM